VYLIRRGSVRAEAKAPASEVDQRALGKLIEDVFGPAEPAWAPVPNHEVDEILLLSSWFQRFPEELERARPVKRGGLKRRFRFFIQFTCSRRYTSATRTSRWDVTREFRPPSAPDATHARALQASHLRR
jgi:hypothetical protein